MSPSRSASANSCKAERNRQPSRRRRASRSQIRFSDGTIYDQMGKIDFVDVTVDARTDTVSCARPSRIRKAADRRPAGARQPRERHARGEGRRPAGRAHRRPGGRLCLRRRGRQGRRQAASSPAAESGADVIVDAGLSGGEQVIVDGLQGDPAGAAVRATPDAAGHSGLIECCPRSSSTGRGSPSSSPSSRRSPASLALYVDSDRAISRHRSAAGLGHHQLSRRLGRRRRRDHCAADRGAGRRRRQDDLHEERQRRRRQLYADCVSFELGTDPDINTVNVNNRVQVALSEPAAGRSAAGRHASRRSRRRCSA